jgi:hypothetical protein
VRAGVDAALGSGYTALEPTALGYTDQRLAQLQIQHAYWALLSPDASERQGASEGTGNKPPQGDATYEQHREETLHAELRVERITFLSPDSASLVYRIYYDGSPSPIISEPQQGAAVRVDGSWKIASSTLCTLANLTATPCASQTNTAPTPPNGWQSVTTLDPAIASAFATLANPDASVAERVAAVDGGSEHQNQIAAGVDADAQWSGKVHFLIVGWREYPNGERDVLYALTTDDGGPATPYPLPATAVRSDGKWYALAQYACGLQGLANQACPRRATDQHGGATVNPPNG